MFCYARLHGLTTREIVFFTDSVLKRLEDVWGRGSRAPTFLTSALNGDELMK
jgi:hypothetical protein